MRLNRKSYLIIAAVLIAESIILNYPAVYAQNIFNSKDEIITIYISPLDSSLYSIKDFLLNDSNYYVHIESGISHELSLMPVKKSSFGIIKINKLKLGDLLEVDVSNSHNHNLQKLSFYEKFIIKCLLSVNFKLGDGNSK